MSAAVLLEIAVKTSIVLLLAWAATWLMGRRSAAAVRHLVHSTNEVRGRPPDEPGHFVLTKFTNTFMRVSIGSPSRCVGRNSQAFTASSAALAKR
jgi:hypothetical protein